MCKQSNFCETNTSYSVVYTTTRVFVLNVQCLSCAKRAIHTVHLEELHMLSHTTSRPWVPVGVIHATAQTPSCFQRHKKFSRLDRHTSLQVDCAVCQLTATTTSLSN